VVSHQQGLKEQAISYLDKLQQIQPAYKGSDRLLQQLRGQPSTSKEGR